MPCPARSAVMTDRRTFLTLSAASLAAGVHVAGHPARASRLANDVIEVGCVGTGGRATHLMSRLAAIPGVRLAAIPGVRLAAVCDVWDDARGRGMKASDAKAVAYTDVRKMLDAGGLDAALVATPDHQHVPVSAACCEAGLDVYCEKPLTHSVEEGDRIIKAVRDNDRIMQVGTQHRSMPHLAEARELLRNGEAGEIYKVRMTWNRNNPTRGRAPAVDASTVDWDLFLGDAPEQPFDSQRMRNWRWYWDFGGGIFTDLMVHWADTVRWMLEPGEVTRAVSVGDHFTTAGLWETPDTVQTLLSFPSAASAGEAAGKPGPQMHFEGTFANHRDRACAELMGSKATLYIDRGRYELIPQHRSGVTPRERLEAPEKLRGLDFYDEVDGAKYHLENWIECVRSRAEPACPVEEGVASADLAHAANAALPGRGAA
ncbi:Gfo/Idh/MocA family protein [Alienimonas chondri]|uniref:Myo-inositol 2-dehydrogenase n=1 Tax=Alienimonas chondri TaxID=2681879 RepID=A0ABX1VDM0_9PLAN|nr:Gfo/Idh/MocA family oxidoreductase [Alienimonas chondri]NNJ25521.1 Myo-inositol 2-dehydrogenase [Alienimonas chondri]